MIGRILFLFFTGRELGFVRVGFFFLLGIVELCGRKRREREVGVNFK